MDSNTVVVMLFLVGVLVAALVVAIIAYPGSKKK